jgi:hypothetical protein
MWAFFLDTLPPIKEKGGESLPYRGMSWASKQEVIYILEECEDMLVS